MFDYLQQFNRLPQELRSKISQKEVMSEINKLEKEYKVNLAALVMKVMVKDIPYNNIPLYLVGQTGLDEKVAKELTEKLKKKIFSSVSDYLKKDKEDENNNSINNNKSVSKKEDHNTEINKVVEKIIKDIDVTLSSLHLKDRLGMVLRTYIKGVRDKISTRSTLSRSIKEGGLGFDNDVIDKIFKLANNYLNQQEEKIEKPKLKVTEEAEKRDKLQSLSENYDLKDSLENKKIKEAEEKGQKIKRDENDDKDKNKNKENNKKQDLYKKYHINREIAPPPPSIIKSKKQEEDENDIEDNKEKEIKTELENNSKGEEVKKEGESDSKAKNIDALKDDKFNVQVGKQEEKKKKDEVEEEKKQKEVDEDKSLKNKIIKEEIGKKDQDNKEKEIKTELENNFEGEKEDESKDDKFKNEKINTQVHGQKEQVQVKKDESKEKSDEKEKVERKDQDDIKEKKKDLSKDDSLNIQKSKIKSDSSSSKKSMQDIKVSPRVMGPIDELRYFNLKNFRRLSNDPAESFSKIKNKIELLDKESYEKRIEGISAWKKNPLNNLYHQIVEESLNKSQPIAKTIEKRKEKNKDYLSSEELEALIEFNKSYMF